MSYSTVENGHRTFESLADTRDKSTSAAKVEEPLAVLPLFSVLRTLMTTTVSSSPLLLSPSMAIMTMLANGTNALLNPDKNFVLRLLLKRTFYAQFCAGETPREVRQTIDGLKNMGFEGVILGYAKEVVMKDGEKDSLSSLNNEALHHATSSEIKSWSDGTLDTLRLAEAGDFVALK